MKKFFLYGTGDYCKTFFEYGLEKQYEIVGLLDGDSSKWNTNLYGYEIISLNAVQDYNDYAYIITAADIGGIADVLMSRGISIYNIDFFCKDDKKIYPYESKYHSIINGRFFRNEAIKQIQIGLLLESFYHKEYEGFSRVIVVGNEEEALIIKGFFETVGNGMDVVVGKKNYNPLRTDKFVLTDSYYKERIRELREVGINDNQWVVVPLFDVAATIG